MEPEKQAAVVTGSAGGFGRSIVEHLLQHGFYVAASDISSEGLNHLQNSINSDKLQIFEMDVRDFENVKKGAEEISRSFPVPVTVLVNNAGLFDRHPVTKPDFSKAAQRIFQVNLQGAFHCTEVFCKSMIAAGYGRIINIASIAGIYGVGQASAYSAAKAGLIAASKSWAGELGKFGINVNAIAPGICRTSMADRENVFRGQTERIILNLIPVRRFGTSADIAECVAFMATCRTNYINGVVIEVDGGIHIPGAEIIQDI